MLSADYQPESEETFNYTQIYFQWDQIPNAETYTLFIQEVGILEDIDFNTSQNSILLQDEFDWNSFYSWIVCSHSITGELINCSDENIFSVNNKKSIIHKIHYFNKEEHLEILKIVKNNNFFVSPKITQIYVFLFLPPEAK